MDTAHDTRSRESRQLDDGIARYLRIGLAVTRQQGLPSTGLRRCVTLSRDTRLGEHASDGAAWNARHGFP